MNDERRDQAGGPDPRLEPVPRIEDSLELVARARRGDGAALNDLFGRYYERVYRIVRIRLGAQLRGVLEACDLVQETFIVAERRIEGFEPRDHGAIIQWLARRLLVGPRAPVGYPYTGTLQIPYPSRELWRKRLAEPSDGDHIVVAWVADQLVGNAGLHVTGRSPRRAHAMQLGMGVRHDHQGRGVGSALMAALVDLADNWLNVIRLELTVFTDNERAIGLYRKFGFEVEGTHRAFALRNGKYADVHAMARLKPKPLP